jgi:hypothetical protein
MKNIHLLPTDKPSKLFIHNAFNDLRFDVEQLKHDNNQHIYITNYEEIKEGDWIGYPNLKKWVPVKYLGGDLIGSEKKIILTTDLDLINDGVQSIDDEFLEWFVENPTCEEVEVKKGKMRLNCDGEEIGFPDMSLYKIIIPKEETKMIECYFIPSNNTSSATICGNCGKEKFLHTIGSGIKVSKSIIITKEEPKFGDSFEDLANVMSTANFMFGVKEEPKQETTGKEFYESADKVITVERQETLEEASWRFNPLKKLDGEFLRAAFIKGAQWQADNIIEELEMHILINEHDWSRNPQVQFRDFIEQFKKK